MKIVKLSHLTLEPNLLFGAIDAIAINGKVHAQAAMIQRIDGQDYQPTSNNVSSDVLISDPAIAKAAADLWHSVAQALANDAGCVVEYVVNGEARRSEPTK